MGFAQFTATAVDSLDYEDLRFDRKLLGNSEQQIKSMWESEAPDTRANTNSLPSTRTLSSPFLAQTSVYTGL